MRCPKCGYNSFDHLESCKKCGKDLAEHKARFNIQSILLSEMPSEVISTAAADAVAASAASSAERHDFAGSGSDAGESDDFGFDFMGDSEDDENLAFDELFEEVPAEDEVEETLPAPAAPAKAAEKPVPLDQELAPGKKPATPGKAPTPEFSFDASEPAGKAASSRPKGPAEFGFDNEDDPDSDIFAETEEDFSLDSIDFEDSDKK